MCDLPFTVCVSSFPFWSHVLIFLPRDSHTHSLAKPTEWEVHRNPSSSLRKIKISTQFHDETTNSIIKFEHFSRFVRSNNAHIWKIGVQFFPLDIEFYYYRIDKRNNHSTYNNNNKRATSVKSIEIKIIVRHCQIKSDLQSHWLLVCLYWWMLVYKIYLHAAIKPMSQFVIIFSVYIH